MPPARSWDELKKWSFCVKEENERPSVLEIAKYYRSYQSYFAAGQFERREIFAYLKAHYPIFRVLYPGCSIHVVPSFFFREVVYVDKNEKAAAFFREMTQLRTFIGREKEFKSDFQLAFIQADYTEVLPLKDQLFDLLISIDAGLVTPAAKFNLKTGGFLLVNDGHSDASLTALDPAFELKGVFHLQRGKYFFSAEGLSRYFQPKNGAPLQPDIVRKQFREIRYLAVADYYLFRKIASNPKR